MPKDIFPVKAAPGIAIIEELKPTTISMTGQKPSRIIQGVIVAMGEDTTGTAGEIVYAEKYGKVGDIIYFLHYYDEGGVDVVYVEGKAYLCIKWADFRGMKI